MELLGVQINIIALLLAAILAFVAGAVWCSPILFSELWRKEVGLSEKQVQKGMTSGMVAGFVILLFITFGFALLQGWMTIPLAIVLQNDSIVINGVVVAFVLWLFVALPSNLLNAVYAQRSWRLSAIDMGYQLLALLIMALTFGLIG